MFTVLQDPLERFYASYSEARSLEGHPLYETFSTMNVAEAAQYCIDQGFDYGRNSQCSALCGGQGDTAEAAIAAMQERFGYVCTTDQIGTLTGYLKKLGLIPPRNRVKLKFKTPYIRRADRKVLSETLTQAVAEDLKLYQHVLKVGPCES
jgi:hypothetical protein